MKLLGDWVGFVSNFTWDHFGEKFRSLCHSTKIPVLNFGSSTCPMERLYFFPQTCPKPSAFGYCSCKQDAKERYCMGTRDNSFVKWKRTISYYRPKWADRSKLTIFKLVPNIPNRNLWSFGLNEKRQRATFLHNLVIANKSRHKQSYSALRHNIDPAFRVTSK